MKNKKQKLMVILMLGFGLSGLQAQTTASTSGGNASGAGGSASFSIGRVFYKSITGTNGSVDEGVQQPYEILIITGLKSANGISLSAVVYPNPVADYLILKVDAATMQNMPSTAYQLYDMSGKLLEAKKLQGTETKIGMTNRVAGSYFLKIINQQSKESQEIKTFKIIKK